MAQATRPTNNDYVKTYFEIPELTKIHGEPTFETSRVLFNQLKANATNVSTTLGMGVVRLLGTSSSHSQVCLCGPRHTICQAT